jgi:hypothetical protein
MLNAIVSVFTHYFSMYELIGNVSGDTYIDEVDTQLDKKTDHRLSYCRNQASQSIFFFRLQRTI